MNKMFKRLILEDIDSFDYLDPNCFKPVDDSKKETEKEHRPECKNDHERGGRKKPKKKVASDEELERVFKSSVNAIDLRRYLQYSNAGNE